MSQAAAKPVRLRVHDTTLATNVLRGVGFQARCACGWEGPMYRDYALASADAQAHNQASREKGSHDAGTD